MASRPTVTILSADGTASGATHPLPKVRRRELPVDA
jgi:large subunit ribosomal protein L4e